MKKLIVSVTFLLMMVSITNAADKKQTAVKESVDNKVVYATTGSSVITMNYAAVLEENTKLRLQAAELNNKMDDLVSRLDYTQMMYSTLNNLQQAELLNTVEDAKSQLDYVGMMHATLLNLANLSGNIK